MQVITVLIDYTILDILNTSLFPVMIPRGPTLGWGGGGGGIM